MAEEAQARPDTAAGQAAAHAEAASQHAQAAAEAAAVTGVDPAELLVPERRDQAHPYQYGQPGRPLKRSHPFVIGFVGALGVFVAYGVAQAVVQARSVVVLVLMSLFLAVGLNPLVEWLMHRGLSRRLAVGAVFVLVIGAFTGFGFALVPALTEQIGNLVQNAPRWLDQLRGNATVARLEEQYGIVTRIQAYLTEGDLAQRAFGGIVGVGKIVAGALFGMLTVLVLTLYFLAVLPAAKRQAYRLVPASRRERFTLLADEVLVRIGGYVAGQLLVAIAAGVSTFLFLAVLTTVAAAPTIGQYELAIAITAGVLSLLPFIGSAVMTVLITALGFADGLAVGIACLVYYLAYQQVENYLVVPAVMRRSVDVPPVLTVVAALVGGALLGIVGALLAVPVAAALLLILREVVMRRMDRA